MPISAGDLSIIRNASVHETRVRMSVLPLIKVAEMQISQGVFTYPVASIEVDNIILYGAMLSLTEVPVGSMVYIGTTAGDNDVATTVIRKQCTATTINIAGKGFGDTGTPVFDPAGLKSNQYITIYANAPIWPIYSRINNGVLYKAFDVEYTDEGSNPAPICNVGAWQAYEITSGGTADVVCDASNSVFWNSKTASSYQWEIRDSSFALVAGAVIAGSEITSTVTYRLSAGWYIISCDLFDTGGASHRATKYVWIDDGSDNVYDSFYIRRDVQDKTGRTMSIEFSGDFTASELYSHAPVIVYSRTEFDGQQVSAGVLVDVFCGFVWDVTAFNDAYDDRIVTCDVLGPGAMLANTGVAPQLISEVTSPANWTEVIEALSNPNGVLWYIFQHHIPAILKLFDFNGLDLTTYPLRRRAYALNSRNALQMVKEVEGQRLNIGFASDGSLYIRHEPSLMTTTERDALDIWMTWTDADTGEEIEFGYRAGYKVGLVDVYSFSYDGYSSQANWSRAPGDVQAAGESVQVINGVTVSSAGGQSELDVLSGHLFAKLNSPQEPLIYHVLGFVDVADPAKMLWHKLILSGSYNPVGISYSHRCVPTRVNRTYRVEEHGGLDIDITITFELETTGLKGQAKFILPDPSLSLDNLVFTPQLTYGWQDASVTPDGLFIDPNYQRMAAVDHYGTLYITEDFAASSPVWSAYDLTLLGLSGTVLQVVENPFDLGNAWVFTHSGIYYLGNIWDNATRSVTLQHTYTTALNVNDDRLNADASIAEADFAVCAINYNTTVGTQAVVTTDGGSTWTEVNVSAFRESDTTYDQMPALFISPKVPGNILVGAFTSTAARTAPGALYRSTNYGTTWAIDSSLGQTFQHGIGGQTAVPFDYADETFLYYGYKDNTTVGTQILQLHRVEGGTPVNITPTLGGYGWMPREGRFSLSVDPKQYKRVAAALYGEKTSDWGKRGVFVSEDAGNTWYTIDGPTSVYYRVAMADNGTSLYLWGASGAIGYSATLGRSIQDKKGNIADYVPGTIIGLIGG